MIDKVTRLPLRWLMTGLQQARKATWFVRRPRTFGVHAVPITPEGRVVLVKLRYAPGWRVPGGGRRRDEAPREAVLRELREEIGLTGFESVEPAGDHEESIDFRRDRSALFVVRGVRYRPRWSLEVEQVAAFDPSALPKDLNGPSVKWLEGLHDKLGRAQAVRI